MNIIKSIINLTKSEVALICDNIYLTDEETDVLKLCLRGKSTQEIALSLCISERSVYRRKKSISKKIQNYNCKNRTSVLL